MSDFMNGYITCMLWCEYDENEEPLEDNYGCREIAHEAMERIQADCAAFVEKAGELISEDNYNGTLREGTLAEYAGHDFWLTRNGHGAGFWDGDWQKEVGERLTTISRDFGEVSPYVGDDGRIYLM